MFQKATLRGVTRKSAITDKVKTQSFVQIRIMAYTLGPSLLLGRFGFKNKRNEKTDSEREVQNLNTHGLIRV